MKQHNATFANFICRFGDEKVLLDYAEEVVIPAFTRDTYVRSYGQRTHYHFYEVEIVELSGDDTAPVLGLAGRFIKDTELTRHQIFDAKQGLIKDEQHMRSAPSIFFVLILNNHRLIYFPETPHAPDLGSFKTTAEQFLRRRHKEYIDELYNEMKKTEQKVTKKALYETHPVPTLEVIALTGAEDVAQFVRRYKTLKQIDFRLVLPNDDIDAGEILGQVRSLGQELNSDRTKLTTANSEGLDIEASIDAVSAATATGNQEVKLSGVDQAGNALSGNNDEFQVSAPVENIPATRRGLIDRLYGIYEGLTRSGTVRAPAVERTVDRIRQLTRLL
ncbi:hypothetical protein ABIE58_003427 [Roseovarius sp. MBR-78]|uniref:hypothetical protein n=1 Tax=Roseovarius sp. MBR-78 TaxID=3156460 RepID=UPI0033972F07